MTTLDEHSAKTLLRMTRDLYPHDTLSDMYYAGVVGALDGEAKDSKDTATLLTEGVKSLDAAKGIKWVDLSDGYRMEVLK